MLAIIALGTVVYLYLRKEQKKFLLRNKNNEISQQSARYNAKAQKRNFFNVSGAYLRLTGISALSGGSIASIMLLMYFFQSWGPNSILPWIVLQATQYNLVSIATAAIYKFESSMQNKTDAILGDIIPLLFNVIGANSWFVMILITNLNGYISNTQLINNIQLSIKAEDVVPWQVPNPASHVVAYQATLQLKSTLQGEIPNLSFALSPYDHNYGYEWSVGYGDTITAEALNYREGEQFTDSLITITIVIHIDELQCNQEPLYLLYSANHGHYTAIAKISDKVNQKMQGLACNSSP